MDRGIDLFAVDRHALRRADPETDFACTDVDDGQDDVVADDDRFIALAGQYEHGFWPPCRLNGWVQSADFRAARSDADKWDLSV
jgi:hypothetical protein